jgi:hypothetical protein
MKQIKTIATDLPDREAFDQKVNEAIADGWRLTKRERVSSLNNRVDYLYAELERGDEPEKKSCENCRHVQTDPYGVPCNQCLLYGKWEPAT